MNKKIKIVKIFKDKKTNKNFFIACTENKVFMQEILDLKSFKCIFDAKEHFGKFISIYDVPDSVSAKNLILLATSDNYLIELDVDKFEQHNDTCIVSFITKIKQEGKTKVIKYDINYARKYTHSYTLLLSTDESKNPKTVIKFDDKHSIITCKFRPKNPALKNSQYYNNYISKNPRAKQFIDHNHLAISFSNNTLYIQHYESKSQIMEFTSYYGNFISLEYTLDGRVLATGTESDHVFIINCETNVLLYSLEGHKNYVTQIMFFENVCQDDNGDTGSVNTKTNDSSNNLNTTNKSVKEKRRSSINFVPIQEASIEQMRNIILKENQAKNDYLNIDFIRNTRTSKGEDLEDNNEEGDKLLTTYDIFTTGMDGYIAVWRIDFYYDEYKFNEKNYSEFMAYSSSYNYCRTDNFTGVHLFPKDKTKLSYSSLVKISNNPIIKIIYNENFFVFVTKKISTGGIVHLKIYNGVTKVEEIIETNFLTQGNLSNEDTDDMITERNKFEKVDIDKDKNDKRESLNQYSNSEKKDRPSTNTPSSRDNSGKNLNTVSNEKSDTSNLPIPSYSENKRKLSVRESRRSIPNQPNQASGKNVNNVNSTSSLNNTKK